MDKAYHPAVVRFFMMQAHYRSILDFSSEALSASEKGYHKLMTALKDLENLQTSDSSSEDVTSIIDGTHPMKSVSQDLCRSGEVTVGEPENVEFVEDVLGIGSPQKSVLSGKV